MMYVRGDVQDNVQNQSTLTVLMDNLSLNIDLVHVTAQITFDINR